MRYSNLRLSISIGLVFASGWSTLASQYVQPTLFFETGTFKGDYLRESSGVAVSRSQPGVLWTHNDSGDRPTIYATNLEGEDLGRFRVTGAQAEDWEDIASGRCPEGTGDGECLYIADTGDNEGRRPHGVIYIVPEPEVPRETNGSNAQTERAHELRVRYPDGPRNIEALAVTASGDILLITKGTSGPIVLYTIPSHKIDAGFVDIDIVDTLPIYPARRLGSLVTAAAVSPNGSRLAVRTYTELYFFESYADGRWRLSGKPCWIGLRQPQGEAVDFIDETSMVLTSESAFGRKAGLARVVCPLGTKSGERP